MSKDAAARELYFSLLQRALTALGDPRLTDTDRARVAEQIHDEIDQFTSAD